jgi:RND family efflux transporter MFP subunit
LFNVGSFRDLTDGQLLERFATDRGEAGELAFAALLERHGPMVLRVCRSVLANRHDAQDAFQGTFLVLVRKARGLWVRESLGPWLHQVAYRTASCARSNQARRQRHERRAASLISEGRGANDDEELGRVIHEEIERLPERFRAPVVLCDLEGRTSEQAARHLGWPIGTVKSRLSRARQRLRARLKRRGLAPSPGSFVSLVRLEAPARLVPAALVEETTHIALRCIATQTMIGGPAALLAKGVLRAMFVSRGLKIATLLLVLGATVSSAGWFASQAGTGAEVPQDRQVEDARGEDTPLFAVKPGSLRVEVVERGSLESAQDADVVSAIEGEATIVFVLPEGSRVKKGEIVCELDSSRVREQLADQDVATKKAHGDFEAARSEVELAEDERQAFELVTMPLQQKALEGRIEEGEDALALEKRREEKVEREDKDNPVAKAEARLAMTRARQALRQAQAELEVFLRYTKDRELRRLQAGVAKARTRAMTLEATFGREKSKHMKLQRQFEDYTLRAPADGILIHARPSPRGGPPVLEQGATVRERQHVFSVFDPAGPIRVNTRVREAWVDQLRAGMHAQIKVDAFADEVVSGVVRTVAPFPDRGSYANSRMNVYPTMVSLERSLPGLRPGMTARVDILVAEREHVLSVPVEAILVYDNRPHAAVTKPDGTFDWREVTLGIANDKFVEVTKGISSGESIALDPLSLLSDVEKRRRHLDEPSTGPSKKARDPRKKP